MVSIYSRCCEFGGGEEVSAFGWGEDVEKQAVDGPEALDGALGGFAERRLELCEGVLDGFEVRAVGREEIVLAPAAWIISATLEPLWRERLSMTTMSPSRSS